MVQTCSKCSRANPTEASYCYYDGFVLGGGVNGGPINPGTQSFPNQFVFPSGKVCRNFDQLAVACQEHWAEAVDLLRQGFLESFLGGLGRADLALAAREAARFPDQERGLDQFLVKLPSQVLEPPKLLVEPTEVNLGQLKVGEDRQIELQLANQGMRLLYGTVTVEGCMWLVLGEAPGTPQKHFQFGSEQVIPIRIRGDQLRAHVKPLEGRLSIESNGGNFLLTVKAEVPVKPFTEGVLAGARSPRQAAEKAKASPKEAAPLFESGAVEKWYRENGWSYPVQGPAASGLGAVQQFFEALGLTPPPKVQISERKVDLQGSVGDSLRHMLEVKTLEKRPVYAHATSDQSWLEVGRARLTGRTATIPLVVPAVPNKGQRILQAKVTVTANGNQRFVVDVHLTVSGEVEFTPDVVPIDEVEELPVAAAEPEPFAAVAEPVAAITTAPAPARTAAPAPARAEPRPAPIARPAPAGAGMGLFHLLPLGLLFGVLIVVLVSDLILPAGGLTGFPGTGGTYPGSGGDDRPDDPEPRIGVAFNEKSRFGIVSLREKDPNNPDKYKRLTSDERGRNNNTCIKIDGAEALFGQQPGVWAKDQKGRPMNALEYKKGAWISIWDGPEKIRVTQVVQIVTGDQTRLLDTCLVTYDLENRDTLPHKVGIRVMLDTFIGTNDGVPFLVPQEDGSYLLDTMKEIPQKDIPDFIQALERSDLKDMGTVAVMGLKLKDKEPIEKLVICRWPENSEVRWRWDPVAMNVPPDKKDSCVALYWAEMKMDPKEKRQIGFTYGLGKVTSTGGSGQLALSAGGAMQPGKVFTVTAYVKNPKPGQKVRLTLPRGLALAEKQVEEQEVKPEKGKDYSQVSWRVKAGDPDDYTIEAALSDGPAREQYKVRIKRSGLFD